MGGHPGVAPSCLRRPVRKAAMESVPRGLCPHCGVEREYDILVIHIGTSHDDCSDCRATLAAIVAMVQPEGRGHGRG